jgi:UDP-N-acetylmuramoylalanine--D-glutamate ligase
MFENKKILILGMARSGYEVSKLLSKFNNELVVTDFNDQNEEHIKEINDLGVTFIKSDVPEDIIDDTFDFLIKNPGIRKDHPCVLKARGLGIKVINEMETAYHFLREDVKIIGITGSNGKTTTTTILYEMLKILMPNVHLAGNIGFPLSQIVMDIKKGDMIVCEISDHQLVDMYDFKTDISVLTNISKVHLDFHKDFDEYKHVKTKIFNHHTKNDIAILNKEDIEVMSLTKDTKSIKKYFSNSNKWDCYIEDNYIMINKERFICLNDIVLKGVHNYENIMCALMVVDELGLDIEKVKPFLKTFSGVEHRLEFVKEINERKIYNDSKSTNTDSTIIALNSFKKPTILLLGGLDRGHSFEPLNRHLKNVKVIISYGETKDRIKNWGEGQNKKAYSFDTLKAATKKAFEISNKGDVILLSPACASWDQFKDFEARGNEFKKEIEKIEKDV